MDKIQKNSEKAKEIDRLIEGMSKEERRLWPIGLVNHKFGIFDTSSEHWVLNDNAEENREIVRYVIDNYNDFSESSALRLFREHNGASLSDVVCLNYCYLKDTGDDKLKFILREEDETYWDGYFDTFLADVLHACNERSYEMDAKEYAKKKKEIKELIEGMFKWWKFLENNKE